MKSRKERLFCHFNGRQFRYIVNSRDNNLYEALQLINIQVCRFDF